MEKEVVRVVQYFSLFNYPPTFEEIYTFCQKNLKSQLKKGVIKFGAWEKDKENRYSIFSTRDGCSSGASIKYGLKIYSREYSIKKNKSSKLKINNETN